MILDSKYLCLRQLDPAIQEEGVRALLKEIGLRESLVSVRVSKDKEYPNSRLAVLEFATHQAAAGTLNSLYSKTLPGGTKQVRLTWAVMPDKGRSSVRAPQYAVYVEELDPTVTDNMLLDFFRDKFSRVKSAKVIMDKDTMVSKGYGFVKFLSSDESERAIQLMNGQKLLGRHVKTSQAHLRQTELEQLEQQTQPYHGPWGAPYTIEFQIKPIQHLVESQSKEERAKPVKKQARRNLKAQLSTVPKLTLAQTSDSERFLREQVSARLYEARKNIALKYF